MEREAIKGTYQVDINGSPTKLVVLSAKNNDMLAQLFRVTASVLSKSPLSHGKTPTKDYKQTSHTKEPLRNQSNDQHYHAPLTSMGSHEKLRHSSMKKANQA